MKRLLVKKYGWGGASKEAFKNAFSSDNLGDTLGSIGGGVSGIVQAGLANDRIADTTEIENEIEDIRNTKSNAYDFTSLINQQGSQDYANTNYDWRDIRGVSGIEMAGNTLSGALSGATTGASVGGPAGALVGAFVGLGSGIAGIFTGNKKAKEKAAELREDAVEANRRMQEMYRNKLTLLDSQFDDQLRANLTAFGGSIHIDPSKKGLFTAAAKRRGMGVQEFANKVLSNKDDYSSTMVKRANFAKNASKWKHSNGGTLHTHGGDFSLPGNFMIIGNGGSHEENPLEGVQMGIDSQGIPNLVEEGETIFDDYVFSDRLTVPKNIRERLKLGKRGISFAEASKKLSKEAEERPNDPISKNGLEASLGNLRATQEEVKMKRDINNYRRSFAKGGRLARRFDAKTPFQSSQLPKSIFSGDPTKIPLPWDLYDFFNNKPKAPTSGEIYRNMMANWNPVGYGQVEETPAPEITAPVVSSYTEPTPVVTLADEGPVASTNTEEGKGKDKGGGSKGYSNNTLGSILRVAPIIGPGIGALLGNEPEYENTDIIRRAVGNIRDISFTPLSNRLTYNPFDRNFYSNKLNQVSAAARRAIENQSGGSRGAAMAGLLAENYNTQGRLGDLYRQAEEYNRAQKERVAQFNRETDQFNTQMALNVDKANVEADIARMKGMAQYAQLRETIKRASEEARSANLKTFFDDLGDLGWDISNKNKVNTNKAQKYTTSGKYKGN